MSWLAIATMLFDVPPEEESSGDTPWLAIVLVLLVAFAVVGVLMARLRKKASQIEEI